MAQKGRFEQKGSRVLTSEPRETQEPAQEQIPSAGQETAAPRMEEGPSPEPEKKAPKRRKRKPEKAPDLPPEEKPLTPLQMVWEIIKNVVTYAIMALAVVMMLFTAVSVSSFDRNDRDILGYKAFIVRSDSMKATDFAAGDLVVIREVDPAALQVGDIIAFQSIDPGTLGETFTHKIRSFTADDFGLRTFVTYGTTTGVDDIYPVPQGNILGQYQFSIPNMGKFFAFMKTAPGYICCIGIPFLLMLLIQGGNSVKYAREIYREKQREQQAKFEAIHTRIARLEAENQELREVIRNLYRRVLSS